MTTAADTFADFVDHLAEALDDHEVSGEEWARRLHFSRYHFDRMIRSVAGEPPQAFRRRVLLERAAYRMITTTRAADRHRRRGGLRLARGVHPRLHQGVRRRRRPPGARGPATSRSRPPAASTSTHPAASGCPHETRSPRWISSPSMVEHHVWLTGEMVRLAERLTDEQLDQLDRARCRRRPADDPVPAVPAGRPDGHVERRARHPRLRLVGRGARVALVAARAARGRGADVPLPRARGRRRQTASTTPSSTRSASRPRCSPTAG